MRKQGRLLAADLRKDSKMKMTNVLGLCSIPAILYELSWSRQLPLLAWWHGHVSERLSFVFVSYTRGSSDPSEIREVNFRNMSTQASYLSDNTPRRVRLDQC